MGETVTGATIVPLHHELRVLARSGDIRTIWDPSQPDEVAQARKTFAELRAKGYLAYAVDKDGGKGEQVRTFDPQLKAIILAPPLRGG